MDMHPAGAPLPRHSVTIGDLSQAPTLADLEEVANGRAQVALHPGALDRAAASDAMLDRLCADRRAIYGVTTGYGPLADRQVEPQDAEALGRGLINHLASGVGDPLPPAEARAIVLARLCALSRGWSAVRPDLLRWMCEALNRGLAPIIPEKGTVGASGDLTPLAHMALAFTGQGGFWSGDRPASGAEMLHAAGLQPLVLRRKEALALVNGTSAMAGIAALNGVRTRRLLRAAALLTTGYAELLGGRRAAWHPLAATARPHPGQLRATALLWSLSEAAPRLQSFQALPARIPDRFDADGVARADALPQDAYSIRCAPQLLGAVDDMAVHHDRVVEIELSAVTDNPLIFPEEEVALHAGNFFGQHVAFASDSLHSAVVMLGVFAERQVARLTDPAMNGGLPPFLSGGAVGFNSGFMGAQVTASALVGELRAGSVPASIQSVPTNANNQDVNTMGTVAARRARGAISDVARIMAVEALCVAQAIELRGDGEAFSPAARAMLTLVRARSAHLGEDRPLSTEIEAVAADLLAGEAENQAALHGLATAIEEF